MITQLSGQTRVMCEQTWPGTCSVKGVQLRPGTEAVVKNPGLKPGPSPDLCLKGYYRTFPCTMNKLYWNQNIPWGHVQTRWIIIRCYFHNEYALNLWQTGGKNTKKHICRMWILPRIGPGFRPVHSQGWTRRWRVTEIALELHCDICCIFTWPKPIPRVIHVIHFLYIPGKVLQAEDI